MCIFLTICFYDLGGMKRKFFVVIVFCGNVKTVILDESIVGVDLYVRRFIWELFIKLKKSNWFYCILYFI